MCFYWSMACLVRSPDLGQLAFSWQLWELPVPQSVAWLPDSPSSQQVGVEGQEPEGLLDPAVWLNVLAERVVPSALGEALRRKAPRLLGAKGIQPSTGASPLTVSLHVWALWTPRNPTCATTGRQSPF